MPEETTATFRVSDAPTLNKKDVERETLEVDVCIVGAGPAGLAAAIRLADLVKKGTAAGELKEPPSICLLEKGAEIGSLGLSGAVMDPRAIVELLGELERLIKGLRLIWALDTPGRPTGTGTFNSADDLRAACIPVIRHLRARGYRVTQQAVAAALHVDVSTLRRAFVRLDVGWGEVLTASK